MSHATVGTALLLVAAILSSCIRQSLEAELVTLIVPSTTTNTTQFEQLCGNRTTNWQLTDQNSSIADALLASFVYATVSGGEEGGGQSVANTTSDDDMLQQSTLHLWNERVRSVGLEIPASALRKNGDGAGLETTLCAEVLVDYLAEIETPNATLEYVDAETARLNFTIRSNTLGVTHLLIWTPLPHATPVTKVRIVVQHYQGIIDNVFRIFVVTFFMVLTFMFGCELNPGVLKKYLKKPIGLAVGLFSQYLCMPLLAFALNAAVQPPYYFAFGLLAVGCCPGGSASNMFTLLLGGDIDLSMLMTFCSSILAIGMMPLWLFLLGRFYLDYGLVKIPFGNMALQIFLFVVPVFGGLLLRYKRPDVARKMIRWTKIGSVLFLLLMFTMGTYLNLYMFRVLSHHLWMIPVGPCLPIGGYLIGVTAGLVTRLNRAQVLALSVETGIQNVGIAFLVLLYSMPQPYGQLGAVVTLLVAMGQPLPLLIAILVRFLWNRCRRGGEKNSATNSDEEKDETTAGAGGAEPERTQLVRKDEKEEDDF